MRNIDMEGSVHLYKNNGDMTLVIVVRTIFKENISYEHMQKALYKASRRHPNFHSVIASNGKGCYYEDSKEPPILQTVDKPYRLGTKEVNYYPYSVCAVDNQLKITAYHCLTDGFGIYEFLKTLLYYYYVELGYDIDDEGLLRTNERAYDEEAELEDSNLKYHDPDYVIKQPELGDNKLFFIPTSYWDDEGEYVYNRFKVTLSTSQIIDIAKSTSSSVTGVLNALIDKAYQETYELEGATLISAVTSNFRKIYTSDTLNNFSGWFLTFYPPTMHGMSLQELSPAMKGMINNYNTSDNTVKVITERTREGFEIRKAPLEEMFRLKEEAIQTRISSRTHLGYLITNVGRINLPKTIEENIEDVEIYLPAMTAPVVFGVASKGDNLVLSVNMSFDGDNLIQGLCKVCEDNYIEIKCQNMGKEEFDKFYIDGVQTN